MTTNVYDRAANAIATKNLDGSVTASVYDTLDRAADTIANCTNTGTTQPAAGATCAGTGTADLTANLRTTSYYDAAGTTIAVRDQKGITVRTIPTMGPN
jgi:YD repeat-containing protein